MTLRRQKTHGAADLISVAGYSSGLEDSKISIDRPPSALWPGLAVARYQTVLQSRTRPKSLVRAHYLQSHRRFAFVKKQSALNVIYQISEVSKLVHS
jgi:hypothetical protein